jgi:hypothetical protein
MLPHMAKPVDDRSNSGSDFPIALDSLLTMVERRP